MEASSNPIGYETIATLCCKAHFGVLNDNEKSCLLQWANESSWNKALYHQIVISEGFINNALREFANVPTDKIRAKVESHIGRPLIAIGNPPSE